jgi:hypothetical protein
MRDDFKSTTLDEIREDEAINKQLFLYVHIYLAYPDGIGCTRIQGTPSYQ